MRLRDLGPLVIETDGREVPVSGARTTAILAVLALRANQRVSVDVLLDVGWGSDQRTHPGLGRSGKLEARLDTQIWRLRRALEPDRVRGEPPQVLINDSAGYRLLALGDQIDSTRFESMADDIRELLALGEFARVVDVADEALALWRGSAYEALADYPAAEPVITRLIESRRQVSARRVDALLETGQSDRALHQLDGLFTDAPFDEHLWAARMLALHRLGRTQEALQTYQDARRTLLDEVGIDPGAELTGLQRRILAGDPDLAPPPPGPRRADAAESARAAPSTVPEPAPESGSRSGSGSGLHGRSADPVVVVRLPPTLTPLLGRADTLGQLASLAATNRLLTITGPAGCGKTRVAIELARGLSGGYRDGTWFVDLGSVQEASVVTDFVLATVGIDPPVTGSGLDGLRAYCRDRAIVLLLDNCEHVLAAASVVAATVAAAAKASLVLATSREPLDVEGEVLWTLGPLALPPARRAPALGTAAAAVSETTPVRYLLPESAADSAATEIEDPAAAPAVALFLQRMRAADPGRELTGDELDQVVEICTALDGLPLAIELAAARVRSATLAEIAAQVIQDPSGLRRVGRGGRPDRSRLRDAIEAGYRLLSEPEQALHRRLAVLPGSFTRDTAAAIGADGLVEAGEVTHLLDSLVHRSLLITAPEQRPGGPTLFRQLATVRGHARHALRAAEEDTSTEQRRDGWAAEFVTRRPRLGFGDDAGWYPAADDALPTIRATLEQSLVREASPAGLRLLSRLTMFWYFRARMAEGQRWGQLAEQAPTDDPVTALTMQVAIAAGEAVRGRADLAVPRIEAVLGGLAASTLTDADPRELIELGDHYAPLAVALTPSAAAAETVSALGRSAEELAGVSGDGGLAVLAQALQVTAAARRIDPGATATRSAHLYEQASEIGHLAAAQIAAGTCVALALAARDPGGRVWAERSYQLHRSQGGSHTGLLLESGANFAAFDADPPTAVRLLSASHASARRAGTTWPRLPITRATLADLEKTVTRSEFDDAWREGLSLGPLPAGRH